MNYRSDIDGLRTIAVFLVILNHVGFSLFSGGFVGVDVFFVISGFLITTIIYSALKKNNFSMSWFLGRRIKRLMPVLLFVIFITTLVFSLLMLPQDLVKYYRSVIWVVSYIGNFFFWREYGGYFDGGSLEAPLLHTWSLAVEEQYYFIWPLMLIVAYRYLGHKGTIITSLLACFAAIMFSQWGTEVTIGAAYYLLPTRFFELLVGSCLALSWQHLPRFNQITNHALSCFGLILIIGSALLLDKNSSFPGYNALYPVIGTALIIFSTTGIINRLLSLKPMVFTGNISYSLYLWHWPILVIFHYTAIELNLVNQFLVIAAIYVISILSWKYIEQPGRHINAKSFKPIFVKFYAMPSIALIMLALLGVNFDGYKSRFSNEILTMDTAFNAHSSKTRKLCHSSYRQSTELPKEQCIFGSVEQQKKAEVFIFGDSHANHLIPFIQTLTDDANLRGQDYTLDRCLPIFNLKWGSNLHKAGLCEKRNKLALEHIKTQAFNYVVLAASWPDFGTRRIFTDQRIEQQAEVEQIFQSQLFATLEVIIQAGAIPIIITDTPTLGGKSPKCMIKNTVFNSGVDCSFQHNENKLINATIAKLTGKYPDLITIEPHKMMCNDDNCTMEINGIPLYRDDDHLNEVGSALLGKIYLKRKGSPFTATIAKGAKTTEHKIIPPSAI
ncbi:MAG: acyltransferase family protein [Litorilituus sp.]|nr:acyltransferase family protein [Litorilituus sp.]